MYTLDVQKIGCLSIMISYYNVFEVSTLHREVDVNDDGESSTKLKVTKCRHVEIVFGICAVASTTFMCTYIHDRVAMML